MSQNVEGSVDKISTVSGDVRCGNVSGSVETVSGEVFCSAVGGRVSTVSGDVRVFGGDVGDKRTMSNRMSEKYELTSETKGKLRRIRALKDIEHFGVKKGDLGGYVESEENLSQDGDAWVHDGAEVYDNAQVFGSAIVSDTARVYGDATVSGNAWVYGSAQVYGKAQVCDNALVLGNALVSDKATVYGAAWVNENAQVFGCATIAGGASIYGNSRVFGDTCVSGDAQISGDAYIASDSDYCVFTHVGSENGILTLYKSQSGPLLATRGCFTGTVDAFEARVKKHSTEQIQKECNHLIAFARLRLGANK